MMMMMSLRLFNVKGLATRLEPAESRRKACAAGETWTLNRHIALVVSLPSGHIISARNGCHDRVQDSLEQYREGEMSRRKPADSQLSQQVPATQHCNAQAPQA